MNSALKNIKRGRGRPRLDTQEEALVSRDIIIDLAYEWARTRSLNDVTFVQLAKELNVVPSSLHYHLGTKDDLTSAIVNRFYQQLLQKMEAIDPTVDWKERIRQFAWILMRSERDHRGVAEHIQTRARFRIFQKVAAGERDYGAAYLDMAFQLFREAGFTATQTANFYHALAVHCLAAANSPSVRMEPAAHVSFLLSQAESFQPGTMPGLDYALSAFASVKADEVFELGLEGLLERFAAERKRP